MRNQNKTDGANWTPSQNPNTVSAKESSAGLVMLQDAPTVNWSRIYFCTHRFARCASKLETNWRRGQPRSRQTRNPSPDREFSLTHHRERTEWAPLMSLGCLYPWRDQIQWLCQLNPLRVNAGTSTRKWVFLENGCSSLMCLIFRLISVDFGKIKSFFRPWLT